MSFEDRPDVAKYDRTGRINVAEYRGSEFSPLRAGRDEVQALAMSEHLLVQIAELIEK